MSPLILVAFGVGALVLFTGGGSEAQSSPPRQAPSRGGKSPRPAPIDPAQVRRLQAALNLYAERVRRPDSQSAVTGTTVRWPLAEDGVDGPQTGAAAVEVLVDSDAVTTVERGGSIPGVEAHPDEGGGAVLVGIYDHGALAAFIEKMVERRGAASTGGSGEAPYTNIPMDDLRGYLSMALGAEREGDVTDAAELYREIITFAPEGSDVHREASRRLAGLRMRHGSGV